MIQPALLLAILAMVIAPIFSPDFTGYDPQRLLVRIERPAIQPEGYAFSIWGVIYLWLLAHAGFGLARRRGDPRFERVALPLLISGLLGTVWLSIAAQAPLLATAVILVMGGFALWAYLRADQRQDRWLLAAPLAIYAGWMTAACAVSVGVMLAGYGILSNTAAALVMLGAVLVVAFWVQAARPALPVYAAAVVWAAIGIVLANWGDLPAVAYSALAGAALLTLWTMIGMRRA